MRTGNSSTMSEHRNDDRGRVAETPSDIPAQGWKDIAARVKDRVQDDHTMLAASGWRSGRSSH